MIYEELIGASVTPFTADGEVDYSEFDYLLTRYEKSNHGGVVICGSTGEGESLTAEEKRRLLERARARQTDMKIIMGLGFGSTAAVSAEVDRYRDMKPAAFLLVVPPYYRAPQEGILAHFVTVCRRYPDERFILYNIPARTGSALEFDTYRRALEACPNIVGLKDCSEDYDFVRRAAKLHPLWCGSDKASLDYLAAGATGFISAASIFYHETFHQLYESYKDGFRDLILDGYIRYFSNLLSLKSNPIGIKALLGLQGRPSTALRLPLVPYGPAEIKRVSALLPASEQPLN